MTTLSRSEIEQRIEQLRPWRYNHIYQYGVITSDNSLTARIHEEYGRDVMTHILRVLLKGRNPQDLRALDLGCLEGHLSDILCSFQFKEVVAVDLSEGHVNRATFLLKKLRGYSNATIVRGNATDEQLISSLGTFHLVVFRGLLYHLKDPLRMFDIFERLIPENGDFAILLGTQYKGSYETVISPYPMAELQIKPLKQYNDNSEDGLLCSPSVGSVFERCSFRLNPAAVYQVLKVYGYKNVIAYDTPYGLLSFNSNLVVTKKHQPGLLVELEKELSIPGVKFYDWDGKSVNSYNFDRRIEARLAGFLKRVFFMVFDSRIIRKQGNWKNLLIRTLIRAVRKLPGIKNEQL
jgi:SAM-dependent methyltransferase